MKKIVLVALLCSMTSLTFAQHLAFGVAGAFNSTWLFNKQDSDAGDELDYASTFGGDVGITTEYMFNEKVGVGVDFTMSSNNQKYDFQVAGISSEGTHKYSSIDIPVLLKVISPGGAYFELGPTISFVTKSEFESDGAPTLDVKDMTASSNIEGTLGFGVDLPVSDVIFISTGLRFNWGFADLNDGYKKDAMGNQESTNTASGGLRLAVKYVIPTK